MTDKKPIRKRTTRQNLSRRRVSPITEPVSITLHGHIALRAYEIYEGRTRQGPIDDWLQADQEVLKQEKTRNKQRS